MGFRFRKSFKIAPGVRMNVSRRGVSTSLGGRGATVNLSKRGTRMTVGIPGTGLSYSQKLLGKSPARGRSNADPSPISGVISLLVILGILIWIFS